jgi:hypothetical protein
LSTELPILLFRGDAEASLLADAEDCLQAILPHRVVQLTAAWAPRPQWLEEDAAPPPESLSRRGLIPDADARRLLERPQRLVIFSLLPSVTMPALRHRSGGSFLAHLGLRAAWTPEQAAAVESECTEEPPLSPVDAAAALEPVIERLHDRGSAVAVCITFRHVREPLEPRKREGTAALRDLIRRTNLEAARLSQRTGCFVLDLDRPLAHEGGASLDADCFGGTGRAAELALEELAAIVLDALPDDSMPSEAT